MLDAAGLSRSIGRIYETLLDDDAERDWLELVRDAVGAEHAVLSEAGDAAITTQTSRIDDDLLPLARHLASTTMDDPALTHMPLLSPCRLSDYVPVRELMRTDVYQQCVRPLHGGYALAFTWTRGRRRTAIAICRDIARRRDFGDDEIAALRPLLLHVQNASELRTRLLRTQAALHQAHGALDAMRDGAVVVDRHCRVQYANAAAAALLQAGDALRSDGGVLQCATGARDERRLHALLGDVLAPAEAVSGADAQSRTGDMLLIARAPPKPALLVSAMPAHDAARLPGRQASPGTAMLLLREAGQAHAPSVDVLMDAFGLTPREAQLALALRDGDALSHAARRLGITEGTARQYLKSVFAKTGVQRQSELVALLSRLA